MVNTVDESLKTINDSGFAFQLGVEHEIRRSQPQHGWTVIAREHQWRNESSNASGFVDLLIGRNDYRMVIECKRRRDASWLFIVPDSEPDRVSRARLEWGDHHIDSASLFGWCDFKIGPESFESDFCVVRGQDEKQKPMIENICGPLLYSQEAVAEEEISLLTKSTTPTTMKYASLIVTNAHLLACRLKPEDVSLTAGEVSSLTNVVQVPYIRFRKGLPSTIRSWDVYMIEDLETANEELQRTVFVVQAAALSPFLQQWQELEPTRDRYGWTPWFTARQRALGQLSI